MFQNKLITRVHVTAIHLLYYMLMINMLGFPYKITLTLMAETQATVWRYYTILS